MPDLPMLYPLLFDPIYKDYLWGSDRIARIFHRKNTPSPCAESWEISQRPEGMSVVENGPYKGVSLDRLVERLTPGALFGKDKIFPFLIKLIDAAKLLSVQVHPSEKTAESLGGEPKTEVWYVLSAAKGAYVYAGLKEGVDAASCMAALQAGAADAVLNRLEVQAGDVIYVPAGVVHAIGAGVLIFEVQQNSNTTYRLYDWDRVGPDGKPRELHIKEGLAAIEPDATWSLSRVHTAKERRGCIVEKLVQSPFFNLDKFTINEPITLQSTGRFQLFFSVSGTTEIAAGRESARLGMGRTALVPAACESFVLTPQVTTVKKSKSAKAAELIRICLP